VCAPTKPIFVSGCCALIASATLQSFFQRRRGRVDDDVIKILRDGEAFF